MLFTLATTGILVTKIILVLYSVIALAIAIERVLTLRHTAAQERAAREALRAAFAVGSRSALARASQFEVPSCVALIVAAEALDRLPGHEHLAAELAFARSAAMLRRGLSALASIASTAPYVGLFGTVLGILTAFHTIAITGQTGASIVAGGVTEALVTTAMGLGVAVPAVLVYNGMVGLVSDVTLLAEGNAREFVAQLIVSDERETVS